MPSIRLAFTGDGAPPEDALTGARAYDFGAALFVADHAPGWGLGSHAFVGGGIGRIRSDLGEGSRVFAEGGGGLTSGFLGVDLSVKFALEPVDITGRASVLHRAADASRHPHVLIMTIEAWLKAACEDAERRGLPDLKPLLETLARSTAALRDADRALDREHPAR